MKIYWKDGALNLRPESEEDGAITSAILFAYGNPELDLVHRIFKVGVADGRLDETNEHPIVAVDVLGNSLIQGIPSDVATDKPLGVKHSVSTD